MTRGGHLELRARQHGVVHVVQPRIGALCGVPNPDVMRTLEVDLPPGEIKRRAEAADWCKRCKVWLRDGDH